MQISEREILEKILLGAKARNWSFDMLCASEGDTLLERVNLSLWDKYQIGKDLLDQCCQVDMEHYRFFEDGKRIGSISLVWGNGEDLIHDYSEGQIQTFLEDIGLLDLDL